MALNTYIQKKEGISSFFLKLNKKDYYFKKNEIPDRSKLFYTSGHVIKYMLNSIGSEINIQKIHADESLKIINRENYTTFGLLLLLKIKSFRHSLKTHLIS
jgi:hypothetical protein